MSVEEQVRSAIGMLDAKPPEVALVMAAGRRRRRARRVVAAALAMVGAAAVLVALLGSVARAPVDRAVSPAAPTTSDQQAAGDDLRIVPADRRGAPVRLSGTSAEGASLDVADLRGSVVVVRLWGSWCLPCVNDISLIDTFDAPGVEELGLAVRDIPENVRAAEADLGVDFPSILDPSGDLTRALTGKRMHLPATVVLDRQGRIAAVAVGRLDSAAPLYRVIARMTE